MTQRNTTLTYRNKDISGQDGYLQGMQTTQLTIIYSMKTLKFIPKERMMKKINENLYKADTQSKT